MKNEYYKVLLICKDQNWDDLRKCDPKNLNWLKLKRYINVNYTLTQKGKDYIDSIITKD